MTLCGAQRVCACECVSVVVAVNAIQMSPEPYRRQSATICQCLFMWTLRYGCEPNVNGEPMPPTTLWPSVGNFDAVNAGPTATVVDAMTSWRLNCFNPLITRTFSDPILIREASISTRGWIKLYFRLHAIFKISFQMPLKLYLTAVIVHLIVICWLNKIPEFLSRNFAFSTKSIILHNVLCLSWLPKCVAALFKN